MSKEQEILKKTNPSDVVENKSFDFGDNGPTEIFRNIFTYLDPQTLNSVALTNKRLYAIVKDIRKGRLRKFQDVLISKDIKNIFDIIMYDQSVHDYSIITFFKNIESTDLYKSEITAEDATTITLLVLKSYIEDEVTVQSLIIKTKTMLDEFFSSFSTVPSKSLPAFIYNQYYFVKSVIENNLEEVKRFERKIYYISSEVSQVATGEIKKLIEKRAQLDELFQYHALKKEEEALIAIQKGANPNFKNNEGNTALHLAVLQGKIDTIKFLLKNTEININAKNKEGKTALHLAVKSGYKIIKLLVRNGANVNAQDDQGNTILHYIANEGKIDNIRLSSSYNKISDENKAWNAINYLLNNYANVNLQNKNGKTALHIATKNKLTTIVELFLKHKVKLDIKDNKNNTVFDIAKKHQLDDITSLFNLFTQKNTNRKLLKQIIKDKVLTQDIITKIYQNNNPEGNKHYSQDLSDFLLASIYRNEEKIQELFIIYWDDLYSIFDRFDPKDVGNFSWLHILYNHFNLIKSVIEAKLKELYVLIKEKNCLICNKAMSDINLSGLSKEEVEEIKKIFIIQLQYNKKFEQALLYENTLKMNEAIENGAHLYIREKKSGTFCTALHIGSLNGNIDFVRYLIELKNFNINIRDAKGYTALHYAVYFNHLDMVKYLISRGIDRDIKSFEGFTAKQIAEEKGFTNIIEFFNQLSSPSILNTSPSKSPTKRGIEDDKKEKSPKQTRLE